jgi:putative ABC transport system ATP-binding protein/lipoprotein-releasing system ATP-binding protein
LGGHNLSSVSERELHRIRNLYVGFVFQFHYLLPELTALENVLTPVRKAADFTSSIQEHEARAQELLIKFGLEGKESRLPRHLSGGEQQRVAIARALVMRPKYLFADEPTGALDSVNGEIVMRLFEEANRQDGTTVILVTHDAGFAARAKRQIRLVDGKIAEDLTTQALIPEAPIPEARE